MQRIESIRPGGTLESNFVDYPLAELLIGILRGNLSGSLDIVLHPEPRNHIYFKNGVPVAVELEDSGVSLVKILVDGGEIPRDRGLDLLRQAEASGVSESELLEQHNILSEGALSEACRRCSRARVVRLFDAGPLEFVFREGTNMSPGASLSILQPLPLVYEGLLKANDQRVVNTFLEENGASSFILGPTYPHGVDPFDWGEDVEHVISRMKEPTNIEMLTETGIKKWVAAAALTSLHLTGMVEIEERETEPRVPAVPPPKVPAITSTPPASAPRSSKETSTEHSGLVIHRASSKQNVLAHEMRNVEKDSAAESLPETLAPDSHKREKEEMEKRLGSQRGSNYFRVLRVVPGTEHSQIERSYRYLLKRNEDEISDPVGLRAVRDFLKEAFECVTDDNRAKRYQKMVEKKHETDRQAFEAEAKIERALRALGDVHTGMAAFLLEWAQALDPSRSDVPVFRAMVEFVRAPKPQRRNDARGLRARILGELQKVPNDLRLKLCYSFVLFEDRDTKGARTLLEEVNDFEHPLARRVAGLLRAR